MAGVPKKPRAPRKGQNRKDQEGHRNHAREAQSEHDHCEEDSCSRKSPDRVAPLSLQTCEGLKLLPEVLFDLPVLFLLISALGQYSLARRIQGGELLLRSRKILAFARKSFLRSRKTLAGTGKPFL